MRVWRRKAREPKKAKPLAFETLKALRVPGRSAGEAEAIRPTLGQPKSFASKVASIITRLKPTARGARRSAEDSAEGDAEGDF